MRKLLADIRGHFSSGSAKRMPWPIANLCAGAVVAPFQEETRMKVNIHKEYGDTRVGDLHNGETFMYESYLYMHFRPGCSEFSHNQPRNSVCCLNLKSGTMRLLDQDQMVQKMRSTVESYPVHRPQSTNF